MITYSKSFWGRIALLLRFYGSAFPRSIPISLLSTLLTVYLSVFAFDAVFSKWNSEVSYQAFAYILGVVIVFRTNVSYGRYVEGRRNAQSMTAAWVDACSQGLAFDAAPPTNGRATDEGRQQFSSCLLHYVSLMHGLALQHLRRDWDLTNLTDHNRAQPPPPAINPGCWQVLRSCALRTGVHQRQSYHEMLPLCVIGGLSADESCRLSVGTALPASTMGNGATPQDGSNGDAHKSHGASKQHAALLSLAEEGVATPLLPGSSAASSDSPLITSAGWGYIPGAAERVNVVLAWLYNLVVQRKYGGGGLGVDAPVLAQVFARLSAGYSAMESCRMLAETPFPFPWAQVVLVALLLYSFSLPFVVVSHVKSTVAAAVITFLAISTYWTLDEVSRDLEDPFVYDPNDVPIPLLQYQFNERLLQLYGALHDPPPATSLRLLDLPRTTSTCASRVMQVSSSFRLSWRGAENGMMAL